MFKEIIDIRAGYHVDFRIPLVVQSFQPVEPAGLHFREGRKKICDPVHGQKCPDG